MRMLTLNLHKTLLWQKTDYAGTSDIETVFTAADSAAEGSELLLAWPMEQLIIEQDDGPRVRLPLAAPSFTGSLKPEDNISDMQANNTNSASIKLETGSYLFCQERRPAQEDPSVWLANFIENFVRDAWWTGSKATGELYLRLVREDNKTAVQLLNRIIQEQP